MAAVIAMERCDSTSPRVRIKSLTARPGTHIYELLPVSDEQVAQDAGLVQVAQSDHVLHPVDGGGVHGLDVGGILGGDPVLLEGGEG